MKEELGLDERVYVCERCGMEKDRDWNAAINLSQYIPQGTTASYAGSDGRGDAKVHATERLQVSVGETTIKTIEGIFCAPQISVGFE